MAVRKKKTTRKKAGRKKAVRKKKATRTKAGRKKAARKKARRKAGARRKAARKKTSASGEAPLAGPAASKLDPRLAVTAARAKSERFADLRKALPGSHRVALATGSLMVPASISASPAGLQSMAAQVSDFAVERLKKQDLVTVLVDSDDPDSVASQVEAWKAESHKLSATTVLVRVPRAHLADLAGMRPVKYVEASTRLRKHNDLALRAAGLLSGAGVGSRTVSQTGAGVLVGVIDNGNRRSAPRLSQGRASRVVDYLDQTSGRHHTATSSGGVRISTASSQSPDTDGHGTHVAGIAAGNGEGSPSQRFAGVAPDADVAAVKTTFDSADIALAVAHVFEVAGQRQQPCVVNLSLGGHFGPHDGSSITERTIDQLCDAPGRVVVVSAGNEGGAAIHAGSRVRPGDRWVADFELTRRVVQGSLLGLLLVQVWTQWEDDLEVSLRSPNGQTFKPPATGSREFDRGKFLVTATRQRAPYSGDRSTTFEILTVPETAVLQGWSLIVEEKSSGGAKVGAAHAWIASEDMGHFTRGFTKSHLVGMPGTAFSAVTVASYATRRRWESRDPAEPSVELDAIKLEDISYFSSPGPTREAHNKPEIAGPGQWLISALSSKATVEELPLWLRVHGAPYVALQGTSMAAPFVSGAIALLLEKRADLHWAEVKRRLIKSAVSDQFTWPCWNERWGYGKVDVARLLTVEPD